MKPILYSASETSFSSNGIGVLSDVISCKVTEERNGAYELSMVYPATGIHYGDMHVSCIIKVSLATSDQLFRIYSITKPINGLVVVDAEHISYQLSYIASSPFTATGANTALAGLKSHALSDCPFSFWTDVSTVGTYNLEVPANIQSQLRGVQGSILDVFGGEYEFDNYTVKLHSARGIDRGVILRYGKNITDIKQEENIAATYTSIVGYYSSEDATVSSDLIDCQYVSSYPYKRTQVVDFTSEYDEPPTKAQLNARATAYMTANNFGIPKVSIDVSFVQLWQTEEYKSIAPLEQVFLCDTVTVEFEKLGISAKAKVTKTVYDVLLERYDSIGIGNVSTNVSTRTVEQVTKLQSTKSALQKAIEHATDLITGELGGYLVINTTPDGHPYELLIMDTQDIATAVNVWRFNQAGWGHSSTGYNGRYTLAATLDGGIVADYITSGKITGIEINNGNGTFRVDSAGNMTASNANITGGTLQVGSYFAVDATGKMWAMSGNFAGNIDGSEIKGSKVISGDPNGYHIEVYAGDINFYYGTTLIASMYSESFYSEVTHAYQNRLRMYGDRFGAYFTGEITMNSNSRIKLDADEDLDLSADGDIGIYAVGQVDINGGSGGYIRITQSNDILMYCDSLYMRGSQGYTGSVVYDIEDNGGGSITWYTRSVRNGIILN